MKTETAAKSGLAGLGAVLAYFSDNFTTTFMWLLILFEGADYITGLVNAFAQKDLSSQKAVRGFIKKALYFILVGVGFGVDYLLQELIAASDLNLNFPAVFGVLTMCYLITTEAVSILENLGEMGITVPFLSKFILKLREKIEEQGEAGE